MKWMIAMKKLLMTSKMSKEYTNLSKRALQNKRILIIKGLSSEGKELFTKIGIPDATKGFAKKIKNKESNTKSK